MPDRVFIQDVSEAQEEFSRAAMIQDYAAIDQSIKWGQLMLSPSEFVESFNAAIDQLPESASQWYRDNYGSGYRLVTEKDGAGEPLGHIQPYVATGR